MTKGDFVKNNKDNRQGVVSDTPTEKGFVYVHWLTRYDKHIHEIAHWTEFVSQDDLVDLSETQAHTGLHELRKHLLR